MPECAWHGHFTLVGCKHKHKRSAVDAKACTSVVRPSSYADTAGRPLSKVTQVLWHFCRGSVWRGAQQAASSLQL